MYSNFSFFAGKIHIATGGKKGYGKGSPNNNIDLALRSYL